jgi:hypothetical protein
MCNVRKVRSTMTGSDQRRGRRNEVSEPSCLLSTIDQIGDQSDCKVMSSFLPPDLVLARGLGLMKRRSTLEAYHISRDLGARHV